jgi:hypothetical protein
MKLSRPFQKPKMTKISFCPDPFPPFSHQQQPKPIITMSKSNVKQPTGKKTIVLISCSKKQDRGARIASALYISPLFRKSLAYARTLAPDNRIFILSSNYGLLKLDDEVVTYDVDLKRQTNEYREAWRTGVVGRLGKLSNLQTDHFILLCPEYYASLIVPPINHNERPLRRMRHGARLHWLNEQLG